MKRNVYGIICIVIVSICAYCNYYQRINESISTDFLLSNVEAMADPETGGTSPECSCKLLWWEPSCIPDGWGKVCAIDAYCFEYTSNCP